MMGGGGQGGFNPLAMMMGLGGQGNSPNNGNGGQPLIMTQYFNWTRLCQTRTIDVINVVEISAGSLTINIEAI